MHEINTDKGSNNIYKERRRYRGSKPTAPGGRLELQKFPSEILINIFSYLDESDFFVLEKISTHFRDLINDEELWKKLFVSHYHTDNFPSFSKSTRFHIEYTKRREALSRWRHSRVVKTRYVISQTPILPAVTATTTQQQPLDTVQFDYPRCACFNDGTITLLQLQHKRSKQRLTYIPCSAPQGCSAMCFNLNSAVFGRLDGHVYGKLLSNKSYLDSVMQFDSSHFTAVTAIATAATEDATIKYDWCVSGAESGELIWWKDGKLVKSLKLSNLPVRRLYLHKDWTIAFTDNDNSNSNSDTPNTIYVIYKLEHVRTIPMPFNHNESSNNLPLFVQVDFGSKLLVVANREEICVLSFNQFSESFGSERRFKVADHYPGNAQSDSPVHITNIFLDTETAHREQLVALAGGDTCYMAALTSVDSVLLFDIRDPNEQLKVSHTINFEDRVFTLVVTNLIIVVALSGSIQILNLLDGSHLKTIQRTEKYPQILKFSKDKIIVGNTNILYFLDFIPNKLNRRNNSKGAIAEDGTVQHGHHNRNVQANKWNELLASQLQLYNEEEDLLERQQRENERLRRAYGGDSCIEEDVQLRIALLESSDDVAGSTNLSQEALPADDAEEQEQLRRAIEESMLLHEAQEEHDQACTETAGQDVAGDGSPGHTITQPADTLTEQEELELAIALSLSELNQ